MDAGNITSLAERRAAKATAEPRTRRPVLTDADVKALRPGERRYDATPGFFVVRGPAANSKASFRVMADLPTGKRLPGQPKTLERTIGTAADYSAKSARTIAQDWLARIKKGEDPKPPSRRVEPTPDAPSDTLAAAWAEYKTRLAKTDAAPSTIRFYEVCYGRLAKWHGYRLADIAADRLRLRREHDRLTKDHGKNAADATVNFLAIVHNHARGYKSELPEWPSAAIDKHGRRSNAHRGMQPADLPKWWAEVHALRNPVKRELLLFMLLSGLRSADARKARWENLDVEEHTLFIPEPKGHRPGNPRKDRAFFLPVTDAMMACIERADAAWTAKPARGKARPRSEWLFPSTRGKLGFFADIRAEHEGEHVKTGHDLRHSFSNMAQAAGVPHPTLSVFLNHAPTDTTGRYPEQKRAALRYRVDFERIGATIMEALGQ